MGVAISSVIPNQETAGPVTSVAFFVCCSCRVFGSRCLHIQDWRSSRRSFPSVIPERRASALRTAAWFKCLAWRDLAVVAIWGIVAAFIALRKFRWSPHHG